MFECVGELFEVWLYGVDFVELLDVVEWSY